VGEYRIIMNIPAYANFGAPTALLALDGSPGHVTGSGSPADYYQGLSTKFAPSDLVSGHGRRSGTSRNVGPLDDATKHHAYIGAHLPADWPGFAIHTGHVGDANIDLSYAKNT